MKILLLGGQLKDQTKQNKTTLSKFKTMHKVAQTETFFFQDNNTSNKSAKNLSK